MPIAKFRLPDGRVARFRVPDGISPAEAQRLVAPELERLSQPEQEPYVPKEEAGFFSALGEGLSTLGAVPETVQYAFSPDAATRKAAAEAAESDLEYQQLLESKGIGDVLTFAKQQAGQAIGFMGAPLAAGAAAAAVSGPLAPITGTAAFLTTAATQYFANTVGRQAQVQEAKAIKGEATEAPDITKALLSSAGQAGLDVLGFRVFKPLGALVGLGGKKAVEDQAEAIVSTALREGADKAAETLLGAAAKGATFEAAQETVQTVLERWGAGLNLGDDEAIREYFEAAAAGGLLGGPLGAGSKFVQDVRNKAVDDLIAEGEKEASGLAFNPQTAADNWSLTEKKIKSEATPLPLVDANNQPLSYTPDVLETFGFSPDFAAITSGTTTLNADQVIGKSVQDQQVTSVLFRNMVDARNDLGRKLKDSAELSRMTPDEMQSNVEQYEKLTLGINTLKSALLKPGDVKYTPASLEIKQNKDGKFFVRDRKTGHRPLSITFTKKEDADAALERLKNEYNDVTDDRANRNAYKVLKPTPPGKTTAPPTAAAATTPAATATTPPPPPTAPTATTPAPPPPPPAPTVTPETAAARDKVNTEFGQQAQEVFDLANNFLDNGVFTTEVEALAEASDVVRSQTEADLEAAAEPTPASNVLDIKEKLEGKEDQELYEGIIYDENVSVENKITKEDMDLFQKAVRYATFIEENKDKFRPTSYFETAFSLPEKIVNLFKGLENKNLPYAQANFDSLRKDAERVINDVDKYMVDYPKAFEGVKIPQKPNLKLVKPESTTEPPPTPPVSRLQEKINALAEDYGEGVRNLVKNEEDFNNVAKFLDRLNVAENDLKQLKRTKSPLVENKQKEVNELNEAFDSALSTGDLSKIKQAAPKTEAPKATKPDEEARKSGEVTVTKFEEGVEDTFVKPAKPTSYSEPLPPVVTPEEVSARIEASGQAKKAKEVAKKVKKDACE